MVLTLRVEHLRFSYGKGVPLLDDVSFRLAAGDVLCLLGPNGSGKTTLLRCVLGIHRAAAGTIWLQGRNLTALTTKHVPGSSPTCHKALRKGPASSSWTSPRRTSITVIRCAFYIPSAPWPSSVTASC